MDMPPVKTTLEEVLSKAENYSTLCFLYLPNYEKWSLASPAALLEPEDIILELDVDDEASLPQAAKDNQLMFHYLIGWLAMKIEMKPNIEKLSKQLNLKMLMLFNYLYW